MADYSIQPIRNAIVLLTNQCNLCCPYCFESHDRQNMNLQTAKDILSFLHRSGSKNIGFTFFGGEPMLEWDSIIVPLVEWERSSFKRSTHFTMTTNGTMLNRERLDFLFDNNIPFMLSMDGDRTTQDYNRPMKNGSSSYDLLMSNIPLILEHWPYQIFRITLTPKSCNSFFRDVLFFEQIGCKNLSAMPNYYEHWSEESKTLLESEILNYEQYVIDSFRSNKAPLLFNDYSKSFYWIVLALESDQKGERRLVQCCQRGAQCGLGVRGSVSVDVHGDIYGCHHISPLSQDSIFYLGDIYHGLDEIRVRNLIEQYDPQKSGSEECTSCSLDSICNGGCASNNYQINGDLHMVPPMFCFWNRLLADSAYRVCQTLGKEENELFIHTFQHRVFMGE